VPGHRPNLISGVNKHQPSIYSTEHSISRPIYIVISIGTVPVIHFSSVWNYDRFIDTFNILKYIVA